MENKDWRLLERLTECFERVLAPQGALIKSPDSLTDLTTGKPREVDVSIRYKIGSVPILIMVECRDRSRVEEQAWIEQLATRRDDVGAHAAIAVSSSGFGETAQLKASKHGIFLRQVRDISDENVASWFRTISCTVDYLTYDLRAVGMVWPDDRYPDGMPKRLKRELKDAWSSPFLLEGPARKPIGLEDTFNLNSLPPPDVPLGQTIPHFILITPGSGTKLYFPHERQHYELKGVELNVKVCHLRETLRVKNLHQYTDENTVLAYAGRGTLRRGLDRPLDFVLLKKSGSSAVEFTIGGPARRSPNKRRKR
jgi:hypothetical protein